MKQLNTFDGEQYQLEDDEAAKLQNILMKDRKAGFVTLRSGEFINTSSIASVTEVETKKYWKGYPLSKDGKSFVRDGERIYLERHNFAEVDEIPIFEDKPTRAGALPTGADMERDAKINTEGLQKLNDMKQKNNLLM